MKFAHRLNFRSWFRDTTVHNASCSWLSVHEKSILLPLLPASLLAMEEPFLFTWMTLYALFSMFPLLHRDKLVLPYLALSALFILLNHVPNGRRTTRNTSSLRSFVIAVSVLCSVVLHVVYLSMHPPSRYPFLFEALIMLVCFSQFVFLTVYTNAKQWMLLKHSNLVDKEKKLLWSLCIWVHQAASFVKALRFLQFDIRPQLNLVRTIRCSQRLKADCLYFS